MWDVAYAQAGGGPSTFISMLPLVLIFAVFYFLLIRPQQRKARDHRNMLAQLKRNDEVMTTGGVFGKVQALTDTEVTLEVAPNMKLRVSRSHIAQLFRGEKTTGGKEVKAK
ncbi:MAG: preprotein translocase subunit YajC [Deltaproteobacteria bacterium]|nr:preprotein translocase subunit YajC [Deltaproteobacteria bacterium]